MRVCANASLPSTSSCSLFTQLGWATLPPVPTRPLLAVLEKLWHTKLRKYGVHLGQKAVSLKWVKAAVKPEVRPKGCKTGTRGALFSIHEKLLCPGPVSDLRSLVPNPMKGRRMLCSGLLRITEVLCLLELYDAAWWSGWTFQAMLFLFCCPEVSWFSPEETAQVNFLLEPTPSHPPIAGIYFSLYLDQNRK